MGGFVTGHLGAATNRADFLFQVQLIDANGTLDTIDFTNVVITCALRMVDQFGATPSITGTNLDGHITIIDAANFRVHFTRDEMTMFAPGDLAVGIAMKLNDGITYPLFSGFVPVVDGVISA
jgi:hypothetical protein